MAVLIFGASGSVGSYLVNRFVDDGRTVFSTSRTHKSDSNVIHYDPMVPETANNLASLPLLDAALWCQGINCNDEIAQIDLPQYLSVIEANVHFVTRSMSVLVNSGKLTTGSRLLIVSSLWQDFTRNNKFSYTVSKAALGGIVRSCSVDLGSRGIFINALLPGPIDNSMTRSHLSDTQIASLPGFVDLADLYHLSSYLCFKNNSTNGQSIIVDLGLSVRRMC